MDIGHGNAGIRRNAEISFPKNTDIINRRGTVEGNRTTFHIHGSGYIFPDVQNIVLPVVGKILAIDLGVVTPQITISTDPVPEVSIEIGSVCTNVERGIDTVESR